MVKFEEALALSLDTEQARRFFIKLHATLMHREKRIRLSEQRLELQCREAIRKQKLAEMRLQSAKASSEQVLVKANLDIQRNSTAAENRRQTLGG